MIVCPMCHYAKLQESGWRMIAGIRVSILSCFHCGYKEYGKEVK